MGHRLYVFDPDCEMAIANGSAYYMPTANILQMSDDLAFIPAYYAGADDYVLISRTIDEAFLEERKELLGVNVHPVTLEDAEKQIPLTVIPWGWSPRICHALKKIGHAKKWKPEFKELYSRKKAYDCLVSVLPKLPFTETCIIPQVCQHIETIEELTAHYPCVAKAPWSSSGRGILFLEKEITNKEREWLSGVLKKQGYLMLEKRLNKVYDFAMEFYAGRSTGISFLGLSEFYTGRKGEYKGNFIGQQGKLEATLCRYLEKGEIALIRDHMIRALTELILPDYEGYLGVDMMIYEDGKGKYRVQPCVEINLRYNMGIVALYLQKCLSESAEGIFNIEYFPRKGDAYLEHLNKQKSYPLETDNGKISKGYINLTPVYSDTHFFAYLLLDN